MTKYNFDLITIGAGSGGVRASRLAGGYGAKVAIVEEFLELLQVLIRLHFPQ